MFLSLPYLLFWLWACSVSGYLPGSHHCTLHNIRPLTATPSRIEPTKPGQSIPSRKLKNPNEIRGSNRYGSENNSTIPSAEEAAAAVGVKPVNQKATKKTWQRAWKLHRRILPLLHSFDQNKPPDSSLSLAVLWWKAISGNDASSPAFDGGLSYDLLPAVMRKIVSKRVSRLYPRLHHANVEIRTAYLDRSITNVAECVREKGESKVRLIILGGGYDTRSIKLRDRGLIDEAFELDLPKVVEAKKHLLTNRLLKRRRNMKAADLPNMLPVDLNEIDNVRRALDQIVSGGKQSECKQWHNIFAFEAVMIYLDEGIPSALLQTCSDVLDSKGLSGSLCFADRLENIPGGDLPAAEVELTRNGWDLIDWLPKPGLARHMGRARLLSSAIKG